MPLPLISDSVLEKKKGGGSLSLIGLPFFLVGIGVIAVAFIPTSVRGGDEFPLFVAIPFGGIFAMAGVAFIFGRSGIRIDKEAGTVTQWWGLPKPIRVKKYPIQNFNYARITKEIRRTDKSSYTVFPVRLASSSTSAEIKLSEERQMQKARQDAESVAKFLHIPIYDNTSGDERIREPDTLDVSIRQRFQEGRESNEIPETPTSLKSKIEYDGAGLRVTTKPTGLTPSIVITVAILSFFEIFAFFFIGKFMFGEQHTQIPLFALALLVVFAGFPALIIFAFLGKAFIAYEEIRADSVSLSVTRRFIGSKTKTIPAKELEELFIANTANTERKGIHIGKTDSISARSDNEEIVFAVGLPREELEYIYALTKAALVS